MELRHLRYFTILAGELHFGQAAARLNIVQPALSMQIKALENELGVELFKRTRREVELTQAGTLFLPEAQRTLAQADYAARVARNSAQGGIGHVRLGFSANAVYSGILGDFVGGVKRDFPKVLITLLEAHPVELMERLQRDNLDIVLSTIVGNALPEDLAWRKLASFPPVLAVPSDHPLASNSVTISDNLRDQPFIGYSGAGDMEGMGLTGYVLGYMPAVACTVSSPSMALRLVAAGLGLTIVPSSLASPLLGVTFIPFYKMQASLDVAVIWASQRLDGGAVRTILHAFLSATPAP